LELLPALRRMPPVFWDNRSVVHLAAGTPDHLRRKLYRTTIEGDRPF
jgi:taurine dioxygenase